MWIGLEVYLGRWKEDLGWNESLENGLSLFWIVISLLQMLFKDKGTFEWSVFIVLIIALIYSSILMVIAFTHGASKKMVFLVAHPVLIFSITMAVILWANKLLEITWYVVIACFILMGFFFLLDWLLKKWLKQRADEADAKDGSELPSKDAFDPGLSNKLSANPEFGDYNSPNTPPPSSGLTPHPFRPYRRRSPF